jgi:type I restriction enzyme S subunit
LGVKTLESLYVFLPSRVEQDEIVRYLDEQLPKYDSLITEKESLINDLEAYKKSLIYEVVTGKRRVV